MKINFNDSKNEDDSFIGLKAGNYESMMKMRKKQVPAIEKSIQDIFKDYSGESVTIILQREDENGMPDHVSIVMAGVSRMECQIAMAKALDKASDKAMEVLIESAKGDPKALIAIAKAVINDTEVED